MSKWFIVVLVGCGLCVSAFAGTVVLVADAKQYAGYQLVFDAAAMDKPRVSIGSLGPTTDSFTKQEALELKGEYFVELTIMHSNKEAELAGTYCLKHKKEFGHFTIISVDPGHSKWQRGPCELN